MKYGYLKSLFISDMRGSVQREEGDDEVDGGILVQEAVHRLLVHGTMDEGEKENRYVVRRGFRSRSITRGSSTNTSI